METKYPKKIKQIMREAPMAYSILMLLDYNQKSVSANELFRRWQRDKKILLHIPCKMRKAASAGKSQKVKSEPLKSKESKLKSFFG